ncbi:MAG: bifunctional phosphoglucose/phosphomannose isomerase [Bacillota bacterium]|nr:bifunctional phosphoglucose/phosphomannose isomerase [Bacillota bacterium]
MTAQKMEKYLWDLPAQFEESLEINIELPQSYHRSYSNVIVTGLGGSAIGGDILRIYSMQKVAMPVLVNRDYTMPAFVGPDTLVLAVSYSGNTEETLSAYEDAKAKGAQIIVVSSGGTLSEWACRDGYPVLTVPGGLVPRAATGYLFVPLGLIFENLGLLQGVREDIKSTVKVLEELRADIEPGVESATNAAKRIAQEMKDRIPVIWGSSSRTDIAALRWKAQINENAKAPAFYNIFPELDHNEIVGFQVPQEVVSKFVVVMLVDPEDHPRIKHRMEITKQVIQDQVYNVLEIEPRGDSFLSNFYSLVYVGDYVSYYLALEYGINPTPVETIDHLKAELAKRP